jgi:hypothetical protein
MLDYNVPLGKLNRGMGVIDVLAAMHKDGQLTPSQKFNASVVGWCIEFVSTQFGFTQNATTTLTPSPPTIHTAPGLLSGG